MVNSWLLVASVGVGHGEPGLHGGPSSLGLGPCLGGLALMGALRGAGGPEPHPTGAAWLLAPNGPLAHGQLGLVHGLALHGFHGLVLGVALHGLHGLVHFTVRGPKDLQPVSHLRES